MERRFEERRERGGRRQGESGRRDVRRERSGRGQVYGERRRGESEGDRRRRNVEGERGAGGGIRRRGTAQERPAGDPEFRNLVRALHVFLKVFHNAAEVEDGREGSAGRLTRLAAQAKKVQPAFLSARTECRLQDNTNDWLKTGLAIMEEHYQGALRPLNEKDG